ncbi:MAG: MarR family winged helix-turn-helix transcriptional regulator [Rhodospirillaceae bacterium]|nr:MarR family winged helix-turn-helix transcriptional regulator [Rhodospirillaceae bacterium]MCY4237055.1 MarR family winged helix-turn-helix transcriptional regulator [Rhodospirillaceae bacterium]MCY4310334.1 MarR family winged helix-turn-helix transcriptional regulator [Rhodospirillaceae bacterium]
MPDGSLDRTALDLLSNCTCQNLRQASRVVTQYFEQTLEPTGLKVTQLPVLAAAATMGPIPMSQLAEALVMDRTTLTRNLQPLERAKLVTVTSGADRRSRMVLATPKGLDALGAALPLWKQAQSDTVEALGRFKWGVLMDTLRATVDATRSAKAP